MHNIIYFIDQHIRSFFLLCCIGFSLQVSNVQAESVTLIRDYTYNASENDSKVSARKAALEQLQKAAIEEVGVQVESSVVSQKSVSEGKLKQDMQLNFKIFSQALTKTRIIEEKWNGEHFYIKAEIEVDPDGITAAMNTLNPSAVKVDVCTDNLDKINTLFKKSANVERNQAMVDIAITTKFDDECNRWQYGVLSTLTRYTNYPTKGYRAFLFEQLSIIESYDIPRLMSAVVGYAIAHSGDLTDDEWRIVLKAMQYMPTNKISRSIRVLAKLDSEAYNQKINDIIQLADEGKLGKPSASKMETIQTIIDVSLYENKKYAADLYLTYAKDLSNVTKLAPIVKTIFEWAYKPNKNNTVNLEATQLADKVINSFFENNDISQFSESANRTLFNIVNPLVNAQRSSRYDASKYRHIINLMQRYPNQFAHIIEARRTTQSEKNLFLLKNNLPALNVCLPSVCIEQAFNKALSSREQNIYLDYLLAYESKSKEVEKGIIKLLDRARVMPSSVNRTHRKTVLIALLENINTTSPKAIELMINYLEDFDYKVPNAAIQALSSIGQPAFEGIKKRFSESKDLSKRRMIQAIETMEPAENILTFLKSLPTPKQSSMQFAIEDAIEAHESINDSTQTE